MIPTWLLPPERDRSYRHQLVFELVPSGILATVTGRWDLVVFAGLIVLPAVRSTWVSWLRAGHVLWPVVLACALAAPLGVRAITVIWLTGCAAGVISAWRHQSPSPVPTAPSAS